MKEVYVNRDIEKEMEKYLNSKEIIAVVGTRQCGKTTLINNFLGNLKNKKIIKVSLDNVKDLELFEKDIDSFSDLYIEGNDILFIDEIQYSKDSGKKLKYLYDTFNIKIFISGSSAAEISIQSLKYLVGRIFVFKLYPFSFREFLRANDKKLLSIYEKGFYKKEILSRLNNYLKPFLIYGGYPRVVLSKTAEEKVKVLENIYNTYLLREIKEILGLQENEKLIKLIKALSLQIGGIINYNELSNLTEFSYSDIKKFINILEKTFICRRITPYYTNKRVELVKSPKIYFYDFGFRNVSIENFSKERSDLGAMYENFIFSELTKANISPKYWHTKSGAEVDFVIEKKETIIPIEIKSTLTKEKITRSFLSFIEKYHPKKGFVLSHDFEGERKLIGCNVFFVSFIKMVNQIEDII